MFDLKDFRGKHEGQDFVVTGSGPSLHNMDFGVLEGKICIAVNSSILKIRTPDYYLTSDGSACLSSHWKYVKEGNFPVLLGRLGCSEHFYNHGDMSDDRVCFYEKEKKDPPIMIEESESIIFGTSSVHCAMHFAVICGAKRIIVLGCDCQYNGDKNYFYNYEGEEKDIWLGEDWESKGYYKGQVLGCASGSGTTIARHGDTDGQLSAMLNYWQKIKLANSDTKIEVVGGKLESVFPKYLGD